MTKKYDKDRANRTKEKKSQTEKKQLESLHLGSSNAFEETENLMPQNEEDISDEKLDDLIGDE